jgi:hypothetical protein
MLQPAASPAGCGWLSRWPGMPGKGPPPVALQWPSSSGPPSVPFWNNTPEGRTIDSYLLRRPPVHVSCLHAGREGRGQVCWTVMSRTGRRFIGYASSWCISPRRSRKSPHKKSNTGTAQVQAHHQPLPPTRQAKAASRRGPKREASAFRDACSVLFCSVLSRTRRVHILMHNPMHCLESACARRCMHNWAMRSWETESPQPTSGRGHEKK